MRKIILDSVFGTSPLLISTNYQSHFFKIWQFIHMIKIKLNIKGYIEQYDPYPVSAYSIPTLPTMGSHILKIPFVLFWNSVLQIKTNIIIYSYFLYFIDKR